MKLFTRVTLFLCFVIPSISLACLWDHDTIKMERTRFPNTLELITGKFLRHSPEFYQWRIENRLKRLESDPSNLSLLDDLAVAYDRTGQQEKAIEVAIRTDKLQPNRYETLANLGTFYIHAGKLEEGLRFIDQAIAINPDAHFGREKYQRALVAYVIKQRKNDSKKLPLADVQLSKTITEDHPVERIDNTFSNFLFESKQVTPEARQSALKGILGIMKFGNYDSPIVLEALGSILADVHGSLPEQDAKLLAARAYLKASYAVPEGLQRNAYKSMAVSLMELQIFESVNLSQQQKIQEIEANLNKELEEAKVWYDELHEKEKSWILVGKDPEAEFDKLYDMEPTTSGLDVVDPKTPEERVRQYVYYSGVALAAAGVLVLFGIIWLILRLRAR